jgi:phosphoserine aminotransferase
MSKQFVNFKGE